jgi:hypothetical protein
LKKMVLPDGTVLRARLPGRPTKDCLFANPMRDSVTLIKIWNMNRFTGFLGVYNCQGAAWISAEKKNVFHDAGGAGAGALTCGVKGCDVHLIAEAATDGGAGWSAPCTAMPPATSWSSRTVRRFPFPSRSWSTMSSPSRRLRSAKHKHIASAHFCNVQLLCLVYVD